jgi:hypothetical protein
MVCERCLEDKEKTEFQTDNSSYCNSCIKKVGQPNLIEPARLNKVNKYNKQKTLSKFSI